ncbi:shikimate kinase [Isoptericola sp. b490]|uniref:shikimate kinase n=1 Tax=Actinotalea lenta TaxID=3064654 RepID=UPI002712F632|nr:shikimate kinase [Isoptericola sp. b490]MDO8120542.1 shikimate kinase [Isoptericola sp. b490]
MTSSDPRPSVVLVGPPGSGVPAVAAAVAARLQLPLVDTDVEVERATGRPVGDVIVSDGEEAFRALERRAVTEALHTAGVVALGGGAVVDASTRGALKEFRAAGGVVVFCDVTLAHAVPRLGFNQPRPVLPGNPRAIWQALMEQRRPHYLEVASVRMDTDGRGPDDVASDVVTAIREQEETA